MRACVIALLLLLPAGSRPAVSSGDITIEAVVAAGQIRKVIPPRAIERRASLREPIRVSVEAIGPSLGPEAAPVTIVEFSDFQCPFCARFVATLKQVREKYGDKVRRVFRQFPLSFHQYAAKAAEASLCAYEQGKFWEMHEAMFADQQALDPDQLKAKAAELGLNTDSFNHALDSEKYAGAVEADIAAGQSAGVSGTPAIFINGRFVNGAVPLEQITAIIDDELRRKGIGG